MNNLKKKIYFIVSFLLVIILYFMELGTLTVHSAAATHAHDGYADIRDSFRCPGTYKITRTYGPPYNNSECLQTHTDNCSCTSYHVCQDIETHHGQAVDWDSYGVFTIRVGHVCDNPYWGGYPRTPTGSTRDRRHDTACDTCGSTVLSNNKNKINAWEFCSANKNSTGKGHYIVGSPTGQPRCKFCGASAGGSYGQRCNRTYPQNKHVKWSSTATYIDATTNSNKSTNMSGMTEYEFVVKYESNPKVNIKCDSNWDSGAIVGYEWIIDDVSRGVVGSTNNKSDAYFFTDFSSPDLKVVDRTTVQCILYTQSGKCILPVTTFYPYFYWLVYDLNGGNFGDKHPNMGVWNNDVEISNPTRPGFTFKGWRITNMDYPGDGDGQGGGVHYWGTGSGFRQHFHSGNTTTGGSCYQTKVYHTHTDECYGFVEHVHEGDTKNGGPCYSDTPDIHKHFGWYVGSGTPYYVSAGVTQVEWNRGGSYSCFSTPVYHTHRDGAGNPYPDNGSTILYKSYNPGGCFVAAGHTHEATGTCSKHYHSDGCYTTTTCGWKGSDDHISEYTSCPECGSGVWVDAQTSVNPDSNNFVHEAGFLFYCKGDVPKKVLSCSIAEGSYTCGSPTNTWRISCGHEAPIDAWNLSCTRPYGDATYELTCTKSEGDIVGTELVCGKTESTVVGYLLSCPYNDGEILDGYEYTWQYDSVNSEYDPYKKSGTVTINSNSPHTENVGISYVPAGVTHFKNLRNRNVGKCVFLEAIWVDDISTETAVEYYYDVTSDDIDSDRDGILTDYVNKYDTKEVTVKNRYLDKSVYIPATPKVDAIGNLVYDTTKYYAECISKAEDNWSPHSIVIGQISRDPQPYNNHTSLKLAVEKISDNTNDSIITSYQYVDDTPYNKKVTTDGSSYISGTGVHSVWWGGINETDTEERTISYPYTQDQGKYKDVGFDRFTLARTEQKNGVYSGTTGARDNASVASTSNNNHDGQVANWKANRNISSKEDHLIRGCNRWIGYSKNLENANVVNYGQVRIDKYAPIAKVKYSLPPDDDDSIAENGSNIKDKIQSVKVTVYDLVDIYNPKCKDHVDEVYSKDGVLNTAYFSVKPSFTKNKVCSGIAELPYSWDSGKTWVADATWDWGKTNKEKTVWVRDNADNYRIIPLQPLEVYNYSPEDDRLGNYTNQDGTYTNDYYTNNGSYSYEDYRGNTVTDDEIKVVSHSNYTGQSGKKGSKGTIVDDTNIVTQASIHNVNDKGLDKNLLAYYYDGANKKETKADRQKDAYTVLQGLRWTKVTDWYYTNNTDLKDKPFGQGIFGTNTDIENGEYENLPNPTLYFTYTLHPRAVITVGLNKDTPKASIGLSQGSSKDKFEDTNYNYDKATKTVKPDLYADGSAIDTNNYSVYMPTDFLTNVYEYDNTKGSGSSLHDFDDVLERTAYETKNYTKGTVYDDSAYDEYISKLNSATETVNKNGITRKAAKNNQAQGISGEYIYKMYAVANFEGWFDSNTHEAENQVESSRTNAIEQNKLESGRSDTEITTKTMYAYSQHRAEDGYDTLVNPNTAFDYARHIYYLIAKWNYQPTSFNLPEPQRYMAIQLNLEGGQIDANSRSGKYQATGGIDPASVKYQKWVSPYVESGYVDGATETNTYLSFKFRFDGWFDAITKNLVKADEPYQSPYDADLYAVWNHETSYSSFELPQVVKPGYVFLGWYTIPQTFVDTDHYGDASIDNVGGVENDAYNRYWAGAGYEINKYKPTGVDGEYVLDKVGKVDKDCAFRQTECSSINYDNSDNRITLYAWFNREPMFVDIYEGLFFEGQDVSYQDLLKLVSVFDYEDDYKEVALAYLNSIPLVTNDHLYIPLIRDDTDDDFNVDEDSLDVEYTLDDVRNKLQVDEFVFDSEHWEKVNEYGTTDYTYQRTDTQGEYTDPNKVIDGIDQNKTKVNSNSSSGTDSTNDLDTDSELINDKDVYPNDPEPNKRWTIQIRNSILYLPISQAADGTVTFEKYDGVYKSKDDGELYYTETAREALCKYIMNADDSKVDKTVRLRIRSIVYENPRESDSKYMNISVPIFNDKGTLIAVRGIDLDKYDQSVTRFVQSRYAKNNGRSDYDKSLGITTTDFYNRYVYTTYRSNINAARVPYRVSKFRLDTSTYRINKIGENVTDWKGKFWVTYEVTDNGIFLGNPLIFKSAITIDYRRECAIQYNQAPIVYVQNLAFLSTDLSSIEDFRTQVLDNQVVLDAEDTRNNIPWWNRNETIKNLKESVEIVGINNIEIDSIAVKKYYQDDDTMYDKLVEEFSGVKQFEDFYKKYHDGSTEDRQKWLCISSFNIIVDAHDQFGKYASGKTVNPNGNQTFNEKTITDLKEPGSGTPPDPTSGEPSVPDLDPATGDDTETEITVYPEDPDDPNPPGPNPPPGPTPTPTPGPDTPKVVQTEQYRTITITFINPDIDGSLNHAHTLNNVRFIDSKYVDSTLNSTSWGEDKDSANSVLREILEDNPSKTAPTRKSDTDYQNDLGNKVDIQISDYTN